MSKEMEFGGWYDIDENSRAWTFPKKGFGRVQKKEDAVIGKDGKMLFVLQYWDKNKRVEKIDGENWTEYANQRFLEVYSPLSSDTYRFESWLVETHGREKLEQWRAAQAALGE